ncbi:MAG: Asp-tRNA(Asn)/Glu-tRNA(Gln) amidotransferase subunit GatC [Erysipelotrichales bacterium]|nr:Asp-tRNA(Asn)/Glu-tRNA(Gln) amidotransferase subunit GatC [Erysipelotrichales bacterium]
MNSSFTPEKVEKLADLLMIGLTEEEKQMVFDEFEVIDANINKLNDIENLKNVEPMTHALDDFKCVLREDVAEESIPLDELLENCDDTEDGQVSVPKVVG